MPDGLKSKTLRGLFWSFSQQLGNQGIHFVITVILARLLLPEQFGLIAMLAIFIAVAQTFVNSGFGQALIQKQDADHVDESSIFYFNIVVGVVTAGLLCLAAPRIAAFYEMPMLVPITRVMSLNLIISAFGILQTALLTKQLDFKTQMKVGLIATSLSGIAGITMAYQGFGVWSLVVHSLSRQFLRTALLWVFHSWRPAWVFSLTSLRSMFNFGSKLLFAGLIHAVFDNLYLLVIGKMFSPADLGFYSRAKRLQQLPVVNISGATGRVTFPVFSSVQNDKTRLKRGVRKALATMAMVNFPLMIGLAIVAKPLVHTLLTDKWLPCVPYLQLLCVIGMLYPMQSINLNVLKAQGRSDLNLRLNIIKNTLKIVFLAITWRWGIEAILWGQIAGSLISYYINCHYTAALINYPIMEQVRDLLPYLGVAGTMGVGVFALQYAGTMKPELLLTLQILTGVALFTLFSAILRLSAFVEIWEIVRRKLFPILLAWLPQRKTGASSKEGQ